MTRDRFVRAVAVIAAAFWVVFGVWALLAPESFFRHIATFEPYNEHFMHDVGAFQLGLGAALIGGLLRWDGLRAALAGTAVACVLHEISHLVDRHLGGRDTDPVGLGILAVATVAAFVMAWPRPRMTSAGTARDEVQAR